MPIIGFIFMRYLSLLSYTVLMFSYSYRYLSEYCKFCISWPFWHSWTFTEVVVDVCKLNWKIAWKNRDLFSICCFRWLKNYPNNTKMAFVTILVSPISLTLKKQPDIPMLSIIIHFVVCVCMRMSSGLCMRRIPKIFLIDLVLFPF